MKRVAAIVVAWLAIVPSTASRSARLTSFVRSTKSSTVTSAPASRSLPYPAGITKPPTASARLIRVLAASALSAVSTFRVSSWSSDSMSSAERSLRSRSTTATSAFGSPPKAIPVTVMIAIGETMPKNSAVRSVSSLRSSTAAMAITDSTPWLRPVPRMSQSQVRTAPTRTRDRRCLRR